MAVQRQTGGKSSSGRFRMWMAVALGILVLIMVFNLASLIFSGEEDKAGPKTVPVRVAAAAQGQVKVVLEQAADIKPWQQILIISKVKGQHIKEILVDRGDRVKDSQVLARLDQTTFMAKRGEVLAKLQEARAAKAATNARLAMLAKDKERFASLIKKGAAAQQKLDHIQADHQAAQAQAKLAEAQIAAAQAALKSIDIALSDHVIRAPMSGYVSARFVDPGALSSDKEPMFQLTNESKVKVITSVAEPDYPLARPGQPAEIRVDAYPGQVFSGKVAVVSPILNPATRSAELEVVLPNTDGRLKAGMYAQVKVVLGSRKTLLVPRQTVTRAPGTGNWFVFVADKGKARQVNVKVGPAFDDKREITAGLKPGQEVVVRGVSLLQDGMPIKLADQGETD
jgi:membrane fusion protein (multidrug efflux system)